MGDGPFDDGGDLKVMGLPPFPQKKAERMGHGGLRFNPGLKAGGV